MLHLWEKLEWSLVKILVNDNYEKEVKYNENKLYF